MRHVPSRPGWAVFLLAVAWTAGPAAAQTAETWDEPSSRPTYMQTGVTVSPDVGFQGGYVALFSRITTEGMGTISVAEDVRVTGHGGLGVRLVRPRDGGVPRAFNVDAGLRTGLRFDSGADVRMRPSLAPFLRFLFGLPGARTAYIEVGASYPVLRAGLWLKRP